MRISMKAIGVLVMTLLVLLSCTTVPLTGRRQLNLIPDSTVLSMSFQEYENFLKNNKLSDNREQTGVVKRVGKKIQSAVESYFTQNNMGGELAQYQWDFNLVDSKDVNAWCMPGGKVVVYSGILPVTKDDTGLAVVIGHEVAHAVAKHGNERMSQGLVAEMGGIALSTALKEKPEQTRQLWMAAFGLGAQVGVLLPYSRLQETEADRLGLIFMAMAGYDPRAASGFWERMAAQKEGAAPPEFLSTHPSDATRIAKIKELVPEALQYYGTPR
jgi:predicted Zn-dependent protease